MLQWKYLWAGWDSATAEACGQNQTNKPDGRGDHSRKARDLLEGDLWLRLIDQDASRNEINEQLTSVLLGSGRRRKRRTGMKRRRRRKGGGEGRKKPTIELKSDLSRHKGKS